MISCIVKIHIPGTAPLYYDAIAPSTCDALIAAMAAFPAASKLSVTARREQQ